MSESSRRKGRQGEDLAAAYLLEQGYVIMARNYRTRYGELDLVCNKDGVLVIIEVKTRWGDKYGCGAQAVIPSKIRRIRRLALEFLAGQEQWWEEIRFDVISILWHDEQHHQIDHIQAAF